MLPGSRPLYVCTKCLREAYKNAVPVRLDYGPSEYKLEEGEHEAREEATLHFK